MCQNAEKRQYKNEPFPDTYLAHLWAGSWHKESAKAEKVFRLNDTVSVHDVIPGFVSVREKLGLNCSD